MHTVQNQISEQFRGWATRSQPSVQICTCYQFRMRVHDKPLCGYHDENLLFSRQNAQHIPRDWACIPDAPVEVSTSHGCTVVTPESSDAAAQFPGQACHNGLSNSTCHEAGASYRRDPYGILCPHIVQSRKLAPNCSKLNCGRTQSLGSTSGPPTSSKQLIWKLCTAKAPGGPLLTAEAPSSVVVTRLPCSCPKFR